MSIDNTNISVEQTVPDQHRSLESQEGPIDLPDLSNAMNARYKTIKSKKSQMTLKRAYVYILSILI
jgi:hypothetical protein